MGGTGVPLRELALVIFVAAAFTYLTTGLVRTFLVRTGQVAEIRLRDSHSQPTPQLGGVAMFTGFAAAVFLAGQLPALTRGFMPVTPEMNAVLWSAGAIVIVGVVDDLVELSALVKLIGQLVAAAIMSGLGLTWTLLFLPVGDGTTVILDQVQGTLLTTFFTVLLINAINFVDGLDGLAAGLGMIAGGAILLFSLTVLHDQGGAVSAYPPAIIAAGLVGMCAGFLPHNFEPSRIFMGDSGAMLIGLLLAAASTSASGKINMSLYGTVDMVALMSPVIVVIAAVFIPVLDLVWAVIRRVSGALALRSRQSAYPSPLAVIGAYAPPYGAGALLVGLSGGVRRGVFFHRSRARGGGTSRACPCWCLRRDPHSAAPGQDWAQVSSDQRGVRIGSLLR